MYSLRLLNSTHLIGAIFCLCFSVTFRQVVAQCSGTPLTMTAGITLQTITSPGYSTAYANDLSCQWLIDSSVAGQQIMFYSDTYDIDCTDSMIIYDGSTTSDTQIGSYCGSAMTSNELVSSTQYVLVTFTTDSATTKTGFELSYITAPDTSATGCTAEYGLTASETSQYLTSNGFPNKYSSNSACRWLITAPGSLSTLQLEVVWSDIEVDGTTCQYDKMHVYSGSYVCENTVLLKDCNRRPGQSHVPTVYTTPGNTALVTFESDSSFQKYGFVLKYTATIVTSTASTATTSTTTQAASSSILAEDLNITLMAVCGLAGAGLVLGIFAIIWLIKHVIGSKKSKKGITTVKSIAPLPARPLFRRRTPDALSFV